MTLSLDALLVRAEDAAGRHRVRRLVVQVLEHHAAARAELKPLLDALLPVGWDEPPEPEDLDEPPAGFDPYAGEGSWRR